MPATRRIGHPRPRELRAAYQAAVAAELAVENARDDEERAILEAEFRRLADACTAIMNS